MPYQRSGWSLEKGLQQSSADSRHALAEKCGKKQGPCCWPVLKLFSKEKKKIWNISQIFSI